MASTRTVNSLARDVLGRELCESLERVDLQCVPLPPDVLTISVDELGRKHLPTEVNQALSKMDPQKGEVGIEIEVKDLRISAHGRGLTLLILVLILGSAGIGTGHLLDLIRSLFGS